MNGHAVADQAVGRNWDCAHDALQEVRQLLVMRPHEFSADSAGPSLRLAMEGLLAIQEQLSSGQENPEHLDTGKFRELLLLSARVQELYRQAMAFYGGLASEMIAHGAWDAASYGPDGLVRT